jgi:hypothetical protein
VRSFQATAEENNAIGQFNAGICCYKAKRHALTLLKGPIRTIHLPNL